MSAPVVRGRPPLGGGNGGSSGGGNGRRSRSRGPGGRARSTSRVRTFAYVDGKEVQPHPEIPGCICTRPYAVVYCRCCGWMLKGARVRTPCPVHQRTMYLLDIEQCARCRSYPPLLTEIQSV